MKELTQLLNKISKNLTDHENEALVYAEQVSNDRVLALVAQALVIAGNILKKTADTIEIENPNLNLKNLEEMSVLASEFDKSEDAFLQKQASLLDEILYSIGASKQSVAEAKKASDKEIEKIKSDSASKPYTYPKEEQDKQGKVEDSRKLFADAVKEYRPLESTLSIRTCPDHPGAQVIRIADSVYQCSLDKAIYNWETGFTTMKGNKIPGGSVSNQTQLLQDRNENTSFETRESKLNR